MFPGGKKDSPVDYQGSRTVEDLANFIRDNGAHKVDAYVAPPPEAEEEDEEEEEETVPEAEVPPVKEEEKVEEPVEASPSPSETTEEKVKESKKPVSNIPPKDEL